MTDQIELTDDEQIAAVNALRRSVNSRISDDDYGLLAAAVAAINELRTENVLLRSLSRDLKRLTESNLTYDDQARDLMGSYDIRPKS